MNPVPWLQMTNMISYQELVRTFLSRKTLALYFFKNPIKGTKSIWIRRFSSFRPQTIKSMAPFFRCLN